MESTKILIGEDVFALLSETDFQHKWDSLYDSCEWATAFQSRGFVSSWYFYNKEEFLPILVYAMDEDKLEGVLALTTPPPNTSGLELRNSRPRIVGAGAYDAEYQAWIASPSQKGLDFIENALKQVSQHFPMHDIMFRFLPPHTPLQWLNQSGYWKKKGVLQPYKRPFIEMKDPEITKIFRKRGYKLKVNRLKRLGKLQFKHITSLEEFTAVLNELTTQFDFRQGAMFNKVSYKGKPNKLAMLTEFFKNNLLHVTVLYLGNDIIASIIAVKGKNYAYLGGINTHSPFYAQHSPGFVHFIMLAQQLIKDDIEIFDLTPGGDAYKERLATGFDQVHELLITNSPTYHLKRQLRVAVHDRLVRAGKRPMSLELELRKKIVEIKGVLVAKKDEAINYFRLLKRKDKIISLHPPQNLPMSIRMDSLPDLLNFEENGPGQSRWKFLESAMRKFEQGKRCYTWSEKGVLMACIWMNSSIVTNTNKLGKFNPTSDLKSLYINPLYQIDAQIFIDAVSKEIAGEFRNLSSETAQMK